MTFDAVALSRLDQGAAAPEPDGEGQLAVLTTNRM
jgi:two-component system nitrogen regulation sensor histidine kinase NtrY